MSPRVTRIIAALGGILGVIMLLTSFALNPGPPAGATTAQAMAYVLQHRDAILLASWLQEVGSFLSITFALALVAFAGAMSRFEGWMTLLGGTILVLVSLVEVTFYILVVEGSASPTATTDEIAAQLITAVQHAYSMLAAPAVFLPLGVVILGSRVLPRIFAYLAFALGAVFAVFGLIVLFVDSLQAVVNVLSILQGFWFLAAAITLLVGAGKVAQSHQEAVLPEAQTASAK